MKRCMRIQGLVLAGRNLTHAHLDVEYAVCPALRYDHDVPCGVQRNTKQHSNAKIRHSQ